MVGVIYGGARRHGTSAILAETVLQGAETEAVHLDSLPLFAFDDRRHAPGGFGPVDAAYAEVMERILDLPVWVVVSPVYWYGFPANLKAFID